MQIDTDVWTNIFTPFFIRSSNDWLLCDAASNLLPLFSSFLHMKSVHTFVTELNPLILLRISY
jgi:hypothetical protein